jgi:3-oxoacyl-[acyl-carrier protein] reductase
MPRPSSPPSSGRHASSAAYGRPDEIAAMVAHLAGPEAGFVTGASLTIDGGFTA